VLAGSPGGFEDFGIKALTQPGNQGGVPLLRGEPDRDIDRRPHRLGGGQRLNCMFESVHLRGEASCRFEGVRRGEDGAKALVAINGADEVPGRFGLVTAMG
jgi:hypothetical protein